MQETGMARKCHRQKTCTYLIFIGEQFWGRAARAFWTRKSSGTLFIFGCKVSIGIVIFTTCREEREWRLACFTKTIQLVEIVKLTVILA